MMDQINFPKCYLWIALNKGIISAVLTLIPLLLSLIHLRAHEIQLLIAYLPSLGVRIEENISSKSPLYIDYSSTAIREVTTPGTISPDVFRASIYLYHNIS